MSEVSRKLGDIAGVVAVVATIAGNPVVAGVAATVAAVANVTAELTAKGPTARGSINDRIIAINHPQTYIIGRSYSAGVQVHDVGFGGEVSDVQNPYRFMATVHSCCGPVESLESVQFDYGAVTFSGNNATGYYADFAYRDFQLGERPEPSALNPQWSGAPNWGTDYKLSSYAALGISLLWDEDGEVFAGGQIPPIGAIWQGVKVYDPRLDDTFSGGSGSHRLDDESTWAYSANPALHAAVYAYGRYVEGNKVFGVDLGEEPIDWSQVVAWANVCDANSWSANGIIYEPGDKWNNLKVICQAGGGQPVLTGGALNFDYQAARISLHDVVKDDLAGGPISGRKGRSWKGRHNTLVGRYRSEQNRWEYVQTDEVSVASFVTADGEEKLDEIQYDLVTDKDQAAELLTYELYQRREEGPFVFTCKPHMRGYGPGDCLTLKQELGVTLVDQKVIIRRRRVDPTSGVVTLTCEAETDSKHTEAIGATTSAPSISYYATSEDLDTVLALNRISRPESRSLITGRIMTDLDPADGLLQGTDTDITIETHTCDYGDKSVSVTGATLTTEDDGTTAIAAETRYHIYYDDIARKGGAVTILATQNINDAINSSTNPGRHYVGSITSDVVGGAGTIGNGSPPPGISEDDFYGTN